MPFLGKLIIKGDLFFKADGTMQCPFNHNLDDLFEAKHQCMIKNNVLILTTKDYNLYLKYIKKIYGNNYLKLFKNK